MATKTKEENSTVHTVLVMFEMCNDSSSNPAVDKYFLIFIKLMFMYGRMASTLVMCVVRTLLPKDCFYIYCVDFGNVRGLNPSMVRLFLSSIKYVHARQRDEARRRAETDRSVKERIANDNAHKETGIINGVLSFTLLSVSALNLALSRCLV